MSKRKLPGGNLLRKKRLRKKRQKFRKALAPIAYLLSRGCFAGDILDDIFEIQTLPPGVTPEFPLDFLRKRDEEV